MMTLGGFILVVGDKLVGLEVLLHRIVFNTVRLLARFSVFVSDII